ncbi:hypothetical protein LXL04_000516 [Taraxacum kok-saghyz]
MSPEPKYLQSADHICKPMQQKRWTKRLKSARRRLETDLTEGERLTWSAGRHRRRSRRSKDCKQRATGGPRRKSRRRSSEPRRSRRSLFRKELETPQKYTRGLLGHCRNECESKLWGTRMDSGTHTIKIRVQGSEI